MNYLFILFDGDGLQSPDKEPAVVGGCFRGRSMTEFEKCLLTKMRIHRGYPQSTLGLIWGRSVTRVSEFISEWAPRWGEAGEDLSILDISEEFLVDTYPESYKSQFGVPVVGSTKGGICAVPDGKDFMTEVPRSNTVLTRASHSDKVGLACTAE